MTLQQFQAHLCEAILASRNEFCAAHPAETPYAVALMLGQVGNYLGLAYATEEALQRTAAQYYEKGYRYDAYEWQELQERDHVEKLAINIRWSHPDDGWYYEDFPERYAIAKLLKQFVSAKEFGEESEQLEEFCMLTLNQLQRDPAWKKLQKQNRLIVGVYEGEDPRNFLRTATCCNSYKTVRQLWAEKWEEEELQSRIKRSDDADDE